MNILSKLLGAFILILFSTASLAQDYYVCDTGDDANDGKSEASPFKSYEKAMDAFNNMFAGSNVLFCRGGNFPVVQEKRLYNSRCGEEKKCTIGDYGDPSKPRPMITTDGQITPIKFQESGNADSDGGYVVKNLTLIAKSKGKAGGIFIYNDVDDLHIDNLHIEGYRIGIHSSGSSALNPGTNGFNDRLLVTNNTIINNYYQGFLGACQNCLIENNHFENNGYANQVLNHNIYLAKSGEPAVGITVRNNVLYKSAIVDGKCSGVSLVAHGLLKDLVIENNLVKEDLGKVMGYCWGISVDPGYSHEEEAFYNVTIRNNKLVNVGSVAIGCASCEGVTITGNEIIDEGGVLRFGIKVPVRAENAVKSKDIVITNNKILLTHLTGNGISIGGEHEAIVSGNEIKLPNKTQTDCFDKFGANLLTDTLNNFCQFHNGISIIDINDEQAESNETIVENSPSNEDSGNQESDIVENQPVEIESPEQQIVDNSPISEETESTSGLSDAEASQQPITVVVESDNENDQPEASSSDTVATNSAEFSVNQETDKTSTLETTKKTRKSSGGGSSGASSSKSKKSSSTDLAITEDVISYTSQGSINVDNTSIMSIETEQMDITSASSKAAPESSKYSVKVKDVIEASRQNNTDIDVTQCRAYAAGRCLMK